MQAGAATSTVQGAGGIELAKQYSDGQALLQHERDPPGHEAAPK